jgi:hypothetical protein
MLSLLQYVCGAFEAWQAERSCCNVHLHLIKRAHTLHLSQCARQGSSLPPAEGCIRKSCRAKGLSIAACKCTGESASASRLPQVKDSMQLPSPTSPHLCYQPPQVQQPVLLKACSCWLLAAP